MIHLAELNENNVCIGVKTVLSGINDGRHVKIAEPDFEYYAWRKYENGQWSDNKFLPDYGQVELGRIETVEKAIVELTMILGGMV